MKIFPTILLMFLCATLGTLSSVYFYANTTEEILSLDQMPRAGATITTINGSDQISASRSVINTNFSNLNTNKFELSDWYATTSATQLVKVGTINTGVWNGTAIGLAYGGTATTTYTAGGLIFYDSALGTLSQSSAAGGLFYSRTSGRLGIGSSAPGYTVQIASTSASIALSDINGPTDLKNWFMRSQGGNLYFASSSDAFATTTMNVKFMGSGEVVIGNQATGTGSGIRLTISDTTVNGNIMRLVDNNGTCDHNPGGASEAISCSSDARLKKNILPTAYTLSDLLKYDVKQYDWKADGSHFDAGVIAQDVLKFAPDQVTLGADGMYKVEEVSVWKLVKSIQDLNAKVDALQAQLDAK